MAAQLDRKQAETIVRQAFREKLAGRGGAGFQERLHNSAIGQGPPHSLVVNVPARHMHVTPSDLEKLFGPGEKLTKLNDLYQQGEFASEQHVTIVGPRQRIIPSVRILGPVRDSSQIELSYTDGVYLGLDLPLRISGNHDGTPGSITLRRGVILAERHVHTSSDDVNYYGVKDGDYMKLHIEGPCRLTPNNVRVRHHKTAVLEVHIDTDERNACDLESATKITLSK